MLYARCDIFPNKCARFLKRYPQIIVGFPIVSCCLCRASSPAYLVKPKRLKIIYPKKGYLSHMGNCCRMLSKSLRSPGCKRYPSDVFRSSQDCQHYHALSSSFQERREILFLQTSPGSKILKYKCRKNHGHACWLHFATRRFQFFRQG